MKNYKLLITVYALLIFGCESSIDPNGFFDKNANGA